MGRKLPHTPRSRITSALRQLWLRSRERAAAIKREGNTCQDCGTKGSKAKGKECKIEVHHIHGIEWDELICLIYRHLLVNPKHLKVKCKDCHNKHHEEDNG
jgi:5-methylcytosine-specific restriction endonuclease McrA